MCIRFCTSSALPSAMMTPETFHDLVQGHLWWMTFSLAPSPCATGVQPQWTSPRSLDKPVQPCPRLFPTSLVSLIPYNETLSRPCSPPLSHPQHTLHHWTYYLFAWLDLLATPSLLQENIHSTEQGTVAFTAYCQVPGKQQMLKEYRCQDCQLSEDNLM